MELDPKVFEEATTTLWSFPDRGNWATHEGTYRGNWSPYVPRNLILKYTHPGDRVLDCFVGGGTTAIECKLLGRRCMGLDINEAAITEAQGKVNFKMPAQDYEIFEPVLKVGDARDLSVVPNDYVDLLCAHPPYANAIRYTKLDADLSRLEVKAFLQEMATVACESYRVVKPGVICAVLIGDLRKNKRVVPLGFWLVDVYLSAGFVLKEIAIKAQHNCQATDAWREKAQKLGFLLLAHEYLFIFEKPK